MILCALYILHGTVLGSIVPFIVLSSVPAHTPVSVPLSVTTSWGGIIIRILIIFLHYRLNQIMKTLQQLRLVSRRFHRHPPGYITPHVILVPKTNGCLVTVVNCSLTLPWWVVVVAPHKMVMERKVKIAWLWRFIEIMWYRSVNHVTSCHHANYSGIITLFFRLTNLVSACKLHSLSLSQILLFMITAACAEDILKYFQNFKT